MPEPALAQRIVDVRTDDGLIQTGCLYEPPDPHPVGVVVIHGSAMNFYHPFVRTVAEGLARRGFPTVAANTRGHDLVSRPVGDKEKVVRLDSIPDDPEPLYGTAFEHLPEVLHDLAAWVGLMRRRGIGRVVLVGHSRGAVKTAFYLANAALADEVAGVLLSPPWLSHERFLASARADAFRRDFERARSLCEEGRGGELIRVRIPMDYLTTAATYVDQYGPEERYNVVRLLPRIPLPVLVVTGTKEVAERFAFDGLPEAMAALRAEKADLAHRSVPDGDHVYSGREEVAVGHVADWLEEVVLPGR